MAVAVVILIGSEHDFFPKLTMQNGIRKNHISDVLGNPHPHPHRHCQNDRTTQNF